MASLTLPVRWYSNETQHGELEIELAAAGPNFRWQYINLTGLCRSV